MELKSIKKNPFIDSEKKDIFGNFNTQKFLIGVAIGAVGAYILSNENAQKNLFKAVAKGNELFHTGIEELKERFEDAEAEMHAKEQ
ncbi:MAG: YtxH domain-containing protein [Arcobacteraceae bacterium]